MSSLHVIIICFLNWCYQWHRFKFYNFRSCPTDWVNCLHDNSWFTLAPFLYHPNLFETFALPYCIKFFSFFNVFVGVKWNSSTHLLRCFFFGSLYFIGFKLSGQKCFSIVVSTFLYSTKLQSLLCVGAPTGYRSIY